MIYEAILKGFNGANDNSDHLVKWIEAPNKESAELAVKAQGWELQYPVELMTNPIFVAEEDIDLFVA